MTYRNPNQTASLDHLALYFQLPKHCLFGPVDLELFFIHRNEKREQALITIIDILIIQYRRLSVSSVTRLVGNSPSLTTPASASASTRSRLIPRQHIWATEVLGSTTTETWPRTTTTAILRDMTIDTNLLLPLRQTPRHHTILHNHTVQVKVTSHQSPSLLDHPSRPSSMIMSIPHSLARR